MKAMGQGSLSSVLAVVVNIGWGLALILTVVGMLLLALSPFVDPPNIEVDLKAPVAFTLDPESHRVTAGGAGVEFARIEDAQGSLHLSPRDSGVVAGGAIAMIAFGALGAWILGNLRGVFGTLRAGRPFVPANATRIRRIGWGLLSLEVARIAYVYLLSYGVVTRFAAEGLRFHTRIEFDVVAIITTLIVFVIAEVFREGARLDEDQSLTV
jgi:DUF2975 family protein